MITLTDDQKQKIADLVRSSPLPAHRWTDRGTAPLSYYMQIAVTYARCFQDPGIAGKPFDDVPESVRDHYDSLSWYNSNFRNADLGDIPFIRKAYVLLTGLGMRESSGDFQCGVDTTSGVDPSAHPTTAECGAWQVSWGLCAAHPELRAIFSEYDSQPTPRTTTTNFGVDTCYQFQACSKGYPEFAIRFAAAGLRIAGGTKGEWGPIRRKEAEVLPIVAELLAAVERVITT